MEPINQAPNQAPTKPTDQHAPVVGSSTPHLGPKNRATRSNILIGVTILAIAIIATFFLLARKPSSKIPSPKSDLKGTVNEVRKATITINKEGFTPATITIKAGTNVTWANTDSAEHAIASDPHPTHTGLKGLESITLNKGGTYTFSFDKPGTYTYHDHLNPYKSMGTVVVE